MRKDSKNDQRQKNKNRKQTAKLKQIDRKGKINGIEIERKEKVKLIGDGPLASTMLAPGHRVEMMACAAKLKQFELKKRMQMITS